MTSEELHITEKAVNFENRDGSIQSTPTKGSWYVKNLEERFNTISHFLGGILMIFGTIVLIIQSKGNQGKIILSLIYGLSNILLFFASGICHSQTLYMNYRSKWSTLDQLAIYIMIAGTYTPITIFYLEGNWRLAILIGQWAFAGIGIILKLFKNNSPRWITAGIYLIQGWMIIPTFSILRQVMSPFLLGMIITGGLSYTIGAVFYITAKQKSNPNKIGAHEIWHIFVLLGAASFYVVVLLSL